MSNELATTTTVSAPADIEAEVPALLKWAQSLTIKTAEEYAAVGERLKSVKGSINRVVEWFKPMKRQADAAKKVILDKEREVLGPLEQTETLVKRAMITHQNEEYRKAEEARRRLQAEADEKARRESEALQKKSEKSVRPETKAKHAEAAAAVSAPVIHVAAEVPKVAGIAMVKVWTFEIVDPALIPREYMVPDTRKIGAIAKALKEGARIDGVRFYYEETVSSRGS